MIGTLASLLLIFAQLSLLAFGGGNTVLPEMQRQVVDVHGWMTAPEFAALFALAQAAPGPNLMVCALIGWQVAGLPGAIVSMMGIVAPASILTAITFSLWERFRHARWRRAVQAGLVPVTIGLVAASAFLLARTTDTSWLLAAVTAAVAVVNFRTKWHPLLLLSAGAVAGLIVLR